MTKKLKLGLILALSFVLVSLASSAFAVNLDWDADTTISLSSPAIDLIIKSGSGATDLVVNTGNIVATVPSGSTFTVTSASRDLIVTNSGNATLAPGCNSSLVKTILITGGDDGNAITITPSSGACEYSAGGGGSTPPATTAAETVTPVVTVPAVTVPIVTAPTVTAPTAPVIIPTLSVKPTVNEMSAVLSAITSQVLYIQANLTSPNVLTLLQDVLVRVAGLQSAISGSPTITFSQSLYNGIQNSDVTALQNFLNSQGTEIYPEGLVTGYFGSLTEKAVQRFQVKYGLAQPGDPGYGYVGPKTRAKINQLLGL